MYSVALMVAEHDNILKLLEVIRAACCGVVEGREIVDGDFRKMIAFARNYADKHHHGKEEQIFFREMSEKLGPAGYNLVQHGMLVEHDLGRLHMSELEKALDRYKEDPRTIDKVNILAEAMGYAGLLQRHIDKENQVVYPFGERSLPQDILRQIDEETQSFEHAAAEAGTQETYLRVLSELAEKYL
jgi:hemerythrin-like domain-containing protein